jgi:site-specific DNA-methyltransferase (adenine-specific)
MYSMTKDASKDGYNVMSDPVLLTARSDSNEFTRQDTIIHGDSIKEIRSLRDSFFDLILSDIPYGIAAEDWDVLHPNTNSALLGSSPGQVKAGAIFKKRGKPINGWSEADKEIPRQYYEWCASWASEWLRVLKPGATAFVFAGRRFGHRCISAMEDAGFSFKDMLAWMRERAPHRAQRLSVVFERRGDRAAAQEWTGWRVGNLRPSFEPILWFVKPYKVGTTIADNALTYGVGPFNEDAYMRYVQSPDNVISCGFAPDEAGLHPTQKPVRLMQALIELATKPGQIVLDPFAGSGSTLIAARNTNRQFVGYESNEEFVAICKNRLSEIDLFSFTK